METLLSDVRYAVHVGWTRGSPRSRRDAGARHRREHDNVQRRERDVLQPCPSRSRSPRHRLEGAHRRPRISTSSRCRTTATGKRRITSSRRPRSSTPRARSQPHQQRRASRCPCASAPASFSARRQTDARTRFSRGRRAGPRARRRVEPWTLDASVRADPRSSAAPFRSTAPRSVVSVMPPIFPVLQRSAPVVGARRLDDQRSEPRRQLVRVDCG